MSFSTAYEESLEIIEEDDPYFIGRTDQWNDRPDGQVVLGYNGEYSKQIIPIDYFEMLGDPEEYGVREKENCRKHICIASGVLKAPRRSDDLYALGFCEGCHESIKKYWRELMERNSDVVTSGLI